MICFAFFSWYPIIREFILSFQQNNFVDPPVWVGLDNFRTVFEDSAFLGRQARDAVFRDLVENTVELLGLGLANGGSVRL